LVFFGQPENILDQCADIVATTFEDYGHALQYQSQQAGKSACVHAGSYVADVSLAPHLTIGDGGRRRARHGCGSVKAICGAPIECGYRLTISIAADAPEHDDREISELILVMMLYRLVDKFKCLQVEWLDPDTVITARQFLGTFTQVAPRKVRSVRQILTRAEDRFTPVDQMASNLEEQFDEILGDAPDASERVTEEQALAHAFRSAGDPDPLIDMDRPDEAPDDKLSRDLQRLTSWGMTGMMAFLSAPVAASMAAVNLLKGEDFRLNTHVLSLTGLLVMLQSSGALASAVNMLN
jgi:hypothetical protein